MSKTLLCIRMLNYLSARDIVTKEELANVLETNPRNIVEYKKDLEACGYEIDSLPGINGGYRLNKRNIIPNLYLKEEEKASLLKASSYLNSRYDFLEKKEALEALGKVLATTYTNNDIHDKLIIDRYPLNMPIDELKSRYNTISSAISSFKKVSIKYKSQKRTMKHIIHPYKLYSYNLAWFVLAFNETINDFGYFKLNRIKEIETLNEGFKISKTYNENDYLDKFSMKQNGDFYDVKILFKYPISNVIDERIYGKNQTIEYKEDKSCILSCKMQNIDNIVSFVLSFGKNAIILEPLSIKDKVKEELELINKNY